MAAAVSLKDPTAEVGTVRILFDTRAFDQGYTGYQYDVTRDGQRFLVNTATQGVERSRIALITNWTAELKK